MSINRLKIWLSGDILYASDLNAEFSNVCNQAVNVDSWTANIPVTSRLPDMDETIPINSSAYVVEDYEIPSGYATEIGTNSIFEIG